LTVTVVTGASAGIGRSIAVRLARRGDPVALLARRKPQLDWIAGQIAEAGGQALALACDVTDAAQVREAMRETEKRLGRIERLVANAGGGSPASVDDFHAADVAATLDLNVVGVAHCIEAVLPDMLARRSGHLVAVSSLAALRGLPSAAAYGAAKAALDNLMESLRVDLAGRGVDVTVIAPGPVRNEAKSKKSRLFSIDLAAATDAIERAIDRRTAYAAFPATVAWAARLGRLLPIPIYDRLVAGRGKPPKRPAGE